MPSPPTLPNGRHIKERIGIFGLPKIGKSHQFWNIAKWHQQLGSDAKFYGINTDTSWDVLYTNEEFCELTNIDWVDAATFQDMINGAKKFHAVLRDQDWLCVDLLDNGWDYVQDEYARMVSADKDVDLEDIGDLWVESKDTKNYPIAGWDWGTPNARYRILANNYILRGPGHRMVVSGQTELMKPSANMKEDEQVRLAREMFKHLGVKPSGQKGDPFRWHTILNVVSMGEKKQGLITGGERSGRRRWMGKPMSNGQMKPEPIDDFFMDYLVGVAGWEM
jgi:hypothetical protein